MAEGKFATRHVESLLRDVALACHDYHNAHVRNLTSRRIQCDEIWSFIGAKAREIRKTPSIKERNKDAGRLLDVDGD